MVPADVLIGDGLVGAHLTCSFSTGYYRLRGGGGYFRRIVPRELSHEIIPQDLQKDVLVSQRPGQRVLGIGAIGGNTMDRHRALRNISTCVQQHRWTTSILHGNAREAGTGQGMDTTLRRFPCRPRRTTSSGDIVTR